MGARFLFCGLIVGTLCSIAGVARGQSAPAVTRAELGNFVTIRLDSTRVKKARAMPVAVTVTQAQPAAAGAAAPPAPVKCVFPAWVSTDNTRVAFGLPNGKCEGGQFSPGKAGFTVALTFDKNVETVGPIDGAIIGLQPHKPAINSVQVHDAQLDGTDRIDFTVFGQDFDPRDEYNQLLFADASKSTDADLLAASLPVSAGSGDCPDAHARHVTAMDLGNSVRFCGPVASDLGSRVKVGLRMRQPGGTDDTLVWSQTAVPLPSLDRSWIKWLAVAATLLLALLLVAIVGQGRRHSVGDRRYGVIATFFIEAETDTYSLSKLQFMLWTAVALFAYAYVMLAQNLIQHIFGFPPFPDNFPGIIGLGAGTSVGSLAITSAKGPKGAGEMLPSWSDLVTSGGVVAADRAQYLLWTVFSVAAFFLLLWRSDPATVTGVPDVPSGLLTISGIGALGYLGGKLVRKGGPVIDEIAIEPPTADAAPGMPPAQPADRVIALTDARTAAGAAQDQLTKLQPSIANIPPSALKAGEQARAAQAALNNALAQARAVLQAAESNKPFDAQTVASAAQQIHDATVAAAAESAKMSAAKDAGSQDAVSAASLAQQAALAGDNLTAAIRALGNAFRGPAPASSSSSTTPPASPVFVQPKRTITLRGRNLSRKGTFQIDSADLPFRMLVDESETDPARKNQPQMVQADSNTAEPDMAAVLKLTIPVATLNAVDQKTAQAWFTFGAADHSFTIVNSDGQKAVLTYKIPPGEAQK